MTCTALLMHYLGPTESAFCGADSGCEVVRKSALSRLIAPSFIPATGMVAYGGLFWLSFIPTQRLMLHWGGALGGVVGLGLLAHQALAIGVYCWLCVIVDALSVAIALSCVALMKVRQSQCDPIKSWAWIGLLALAVNAPSVWERVGLTAPLPKPIIALQNPNALNVFEFVDFQCPHCRRLHPVVKAELERLTTPVHFLRFHLPLSIHPLAGGAARAAVCAATLGKEEAMANLLFEQPLTPNIWFEHAKTLGLPAATFESCLTSDATAGTLSEHADLFKQAGAGGLPLTFIGETMLEGSHPARVVEAFDKALAPAPTRLSAGLFLVLLAAVTAGVAVAGWKRQPSATDAE